MSRPSLHRPMPDDFPVHAKTMTLLELRKLYSAGQYLVERWHKENGGNPRNQLKPVPADFTALAPTMTCYALQRHYGVGDRMIQRWLRETGSKTGRIYARPWLKRQAPEDFAQLAPTMSHRDLAAHYKCSRDTVRQWLDLLNLRSIGRHSRPKPPPRETPFRSTIFGQRLKVHHDDLRAHTQYDMAADVLRRERFIVYRCGPTGKFLAKGLHWRVGNIVISPDELLQRAARYEAKAA